MAKDRAKLDRSRDFSEVTGPGLFYRFGQDGKYFGADEVEIFPSEILDMEQAAVPDAAAKALEAGKGFIARAKAEADRFKDRAAAAEAANLTKDAEIADLKAQLAAGQTVDVAALQQQIVDLQGNIATQGALVSTLQSEAADKDRELSESSDALAKANATIAELQALLEPNAEPPATPEPTPVPSAAPAATSAAPVADAPAEVPAPANAPVDVAPADAPADQPPA